MANLPSNMSSVSYTGVSASEITIKNLYESDLHNYGITYLPNVKARRQLVKGDVSDLFQSYSCDFSPSGSTTLSESFITPFNMKINLQECYDNYWGSFLADQTEISLKGGIPQTFFDWMFGTILVHEIKKEYEEIFFNGDTGYTGTSKTYLKLGDGIVKQLNANTGVTKVSGTSLTTSNIIGEVGKVAQEVLKFEDINIDGFKIFMNYVDYRKLVTALGVNANSPLVTQVWSNFSKEGDKVYAYGYEIVPCRIDKNKMIATDPRNLVLGYDVEDSETSYKIIDMRESTLDNQFRVAVITNMAIGTVFPESIILYK